MTYLFGAITALFLAMSLGLLLNLRWVRRLPALRDLADTADDSAALCSIVLAARNEEARIEQTLRRLLEQQGIRVEIIVVDDRSTDRTSEVVQKLAKEDPRVRGLRVGKLPDGWLGKCHACFEGARAATGTWILFTDADCMLQADVITRALRVAAREGVDHIAVLPAVAPGTLPARGWHLAFLLSLANWIAGVNQDKPRSHLGMGAFNLVRTDLYRRCGGYEALRLTVIDDVRLGLLVRRAGGKTRAFLSRDEVQCHWGETARERIQLMTKNYFAAIDYRTGVVVGLAVTAAALAALTSVGPFTGLPTGFAAPVAWFSLAVPAAVCARRVGWGLSSALMTPLIFPLLWYAVIKSTVVTLRNGGVRWRETFYPLKVLRDGDVKTLFRRGEKTKSHWFF